MKIDLYSDTQSKPTEAMRAAISSAPVGDEQKGTDPTVTRLLETVAEQLGKPAAIFLPSGTMCNVIAVASHCNRGEVVITESSSHLMRYELGGMAAISGVLPEVIYGEGGQFTAQDVLAHYQAGSHYTPATTLVTVEQSCNLAGGTVWPVAKLQAVADQAHGLGMKTHMDGARLLNAVVSTGAPASEHCAGYDSVWIDFSKGLGAPFGAVLCGSQAFIEKAWLWKHRLGGAMRQAGMMAAGCLYALEHFQVQMEIDHANAAMMNSGLQKIPNIRVKHEETDSNIVYFDLVDLEVDTQQFLGMLDERGLKIGYVGGGFRALTYGGITADHIQQALEIIETVIDEVRHKALAGS